MTITELDELNLIEIEKADKTTLVDIQSVKVDPTQPPAQRMENYLAQIKNPYLFLCDDTVVKIRFKQNESDLKNKLKNYYVNVKNT